jgi:putative flippase GtrA
MSELIPRSFLLAGTLAELVRYAIVGLILNFIGYVMYLAVTAYWLSPVVTVSIFYPLSVLAGYCAHRRHTFRHDSTGLHGLKLIRYIVVYAVGYLINIALLDYLHGVLGYPHQWVQAAAIFVVAGFLFVAMKFFVFREAAHG